MFAGFNYRCIFTSELKTTTKKIEIMKTTKLNAGFYKVETNGETLQIVAYNTDVKEPTFWMVQQKNGLGYFYDLDIEFATEKDCLEYIKNNY